MIGGLLDRFGLSSDGLLQLVQDAAFAKIAPAIEALFAELRSHVLAHLAGDPPADFEKALARQGVAGLNPETQKKLWLAAVDAAAAPKAAA